MLTNLVEGGEGGGGVGEDDAVQQAAQGEGRHGRQLSGARGTAARPAPHPSDTATTGAGAAAAWADTPQAVFINVHWAEIHQNKDKLIVRSFWSLHFNEKLASADI